MDRSYPHTFASEPACVLLLLASLAFGAYSAGLILPFANHDEVLFLFGSEEWISPALHLKFGRPLLGLSLQSVFGPILDVQTLSLLRCMNIGLWVLTCAWVYLWLRELGASRTKAFAISALPVFVVANQVIILETTLFLGGAAAFIAILSARVVGQIDLTRERFKQAVLFLIAVAGLVATLLYYQVFAMLYWFGCFVGIYYAEATTRSRLVRMMVQLGAFGAACVIYLLVVEVLRSHFQVGMHDKYATAFFEPAVLGSLLRHFVLVTLPGAFAFFVLPQQNAWIYLAAAVGAVFAMLGIAARTDETVRARATLLGLAMVLVVLSNLPSLLSTGNQPVRTALATHAIIAALVMDGLWSVSKVGPARLSAVMCIGLLLVQCAAAALYTARYIVWPGALEWRWVQNQLAVYKHTPPEELSYVPCAVGNATDISVLSLSDPAAYFSWQAAIPVQGRTPLATEALVRAAFREKVSSGTTISVRREQSGEAQVSLDFQQLCSLLQQR